MGGFDLTSPSDIDSQMIALERSRRSRLGETVVIALLGILSLTAILTSAYSLHYRKYVCYGGCDLFDDSYLLFGPLTAIVIVCATIPACFLLARIASSGKPKPGGDSKATASDRMLNRAKRTTGFYLIRAVIAELIVAVVLLFAITLAPGPVDDYYPPIVVGLEVHSNNGNWHVVVASVSSSGIHFQVDNLTVTMYDRDGAIVQRLNHVPVVNLTEANWDTYRVAFQGFWNWTEMYPGDSFIIDKMTYPQGYRFQIEDKTRAIYASKILG